MLSPDKVLAGIVRMFRCEGTRNDVGRFLTRGDGSTITDVQIEIVRRGMTDERLSSIWDACLDTDQGAAAVVFKKLSVAELVVFCEKMGIVEIEK